jgi:hypothetical protein
MSARSSLAGALAVAATGVTAAFAQQPLQTSPITPGFWSWPREKTVDAQAVANACRDKIAIQFANGHYFGLILRGADKKALPAPVVDEVGLCKFDPATQIERCELRVNQQDGTVKVGTIESSFAVEAGTIKMTVTPRVVDGKPVNEPSFDVFPTPCPETIVWSTLIGEQGSK